MSELNKTERIEIFASAASLLIEQYIASERPGWNDHLAGLRVSNKPSKNIRKAS